MSPDKQPSHSDNKNISIGGDVVDSVVIAGDKNVVNQTIIQKFFNIFKSDAETLEQRNRRILLNHVENAWIKGVLDASLHGAAMLDLGIKQDPEAVTKYPWAIKQEATDETLPAGTSMLEIFDSIGMGRSLLILGAPGSGKTTMLLELARGLIARARDDVTQPIPMVFNLSSWTEAKTLADWLAQELNNLYSVPRKTAPDWVKGNKLLLLLDGLDEVRQESRAKCVGAINEFRKQNGLTSLAVCSRSQDYVDLKAKLSFEGAIEVQPLTQGQIAEFFNRFGDEMAGIKQALEKDGSLKEMAETPLFLSIMLMAYRDKQDLEILELGDEKASRKHLFDTYIERMFERSKHSRNEIFKKQNVLHWLQWLSYKMIEHNQVPFLIERIQPSWLNTLPLSKPVGESFASQNDEIHAADVSTFPSKKSVSKLFIHEFVEMVRSLDGRDVDLGPNLSAQLIGNEIHTDDESSVYSRKAIIGMFVGMIVGTAGLLVGVLLEAPANIFRQYGGVILGASLVVGLFLGWINGGEAVIQYYATRFLISKRNHLPWRLAPFLDHCVNLIFLRRVGGGYIFIHRLLMEHFAEMYTEG
jgi:hypothetical protein